MGVVRDEVSKVGRGQQAIAVLVSHNKYMAFTLRETEAIAEF